MNRFLKSGLTTVLAASTILGLSACGSSTSSKPFMTFQIWDTAQKAGMESLVKAYEKSNPNVDIQVQVTNWDEYWTKLEAAATSNSMPDIFWMHTNEIYKYADKGVLADCTSIVDTKNFSDVSISNTKGTDTSKLYGVPKDKDTIGLVYNKELFDKAGVAYPDENWTWDDLVSASEKINAKTGKYGYMAYADDQLGYWNFVYQAGGYILNADKTKGGFLDAGTKKAMKFYTGLQKNKWCPTQKFFAETSPGDAFFSGKGAMFLEGDWNVYNEAKTYPKMNGKWDVAVLPKCPDPVKGDGRASISNGLCYATAAKGKNKTQAMKFLKWLGTKEAQKLEGESGAAIPAYKGLESTWTNVATKKGYKLSVNKYVDMFKYSVQSVNNASRPTWKTQVSDELLKIYAGTDTLDAGLAKMQSYVDKASAKK